MIQIILILLFSILIFSYLVFRFLVDFVGIGYAYVIDQFLPLITTSIVAVMVVRKYVSRNALRKYMESNRKPILLIVAVTLLVHGLVVGNYFMGEEPTTILSSINADNREKFVSGILRGYHYGVYVLSYQLFSTNATLYNVIALLFYILTAVIFYVFLNLLFKRKVLPALLGALFFVTTPAYLDMFFWQSNVSGMPIALATGILSLIFLFNYQKNNKFSFYLLSLMFFLTMLKIGFVRLHAFIVLPAFMCLFPLFGRLSRISVKSFVLALPFVLILLSFLLMVFIIPDHVIERLFPQFFPISMYAGLPVTVRGATLNTENYFMVLSMFVAYLFIPSRFAESYYSYIRNWIVPAHINITFMLGFFSIGVLLTIGLIALMDIRKVWGRLAIFALLIIFAHIVLTPLLIQGYSDKLLIDQRFSNTGVSNGPGIRYVFVSAMGVSLLVGTLVFWVVSKHKRFKTVLLALLFLLFSYYSYLDITSYLSALKGVNPGQSKVPNDVFALVPRDGKKKLLFSANPEMNSIDSKIGDWLHAFYKIDELKYTSSFKEVRKDIASGLYERNNFYAFYNNTITQTFKDITDLARGELFDNKVNIDTKQLVQEIFLNTSYTETDNHSFPLVLNRGIYSSPELNLQLLVPQELTISIHKTDLPKRYPYIDAFVVDDEKNWRGLPFPMDIWDMLKNKPVFVDITQLNLALSVPSIKATIDKVPYGLRIKAAKGMAGRETPNSEGEITLSDFDKINKHYIDREEILDAFSESSNFNSLSLVYVCAEDVDWERQKNTPLVVGAVWYKKEFPVKDGATEKISFSLTCFGSVLRKIILVSIPIPSQVTAKIGL